jgi:sugar transferase EpsL
MHDRVKRLIDVLGATVLLVVTLPLLIVAALLVRLTTGSPVLFRQKRGGLGGKVFTLCKLRTMRLESDEPRSSASGEDRLTRVGIWLRCTSIDELPQLWNVLRGDMSLVGPRPLLLEYLPRYSRDQSRRHEVRPGITGLVQVSGRNALSWDERLALDVWYVDHRSLWLDLKILGRTVIAVLTGRGARDGHLMSAEFMGAPRHDS